MQNVTSGFKGKAERNKLIRRYVDKSREEWVLKEDVEFNTPSGAIKFVMGSSLNGWNYWYLSENNKPLHSIKEITNTTN